MKQLIEIQEKLKESPLNAISVYDTIRMKAVLNTATAEYINKTYGSVDDFFEDTYKKGGRSLSIQYRRKSGTSSKPIGEPFPFIMKDAAQPETTTAQQPLQAHVAPAPPYYVPALNGGMGMTGGLMGGLSSVDISNIHRMADYTRIAQEVEFLKAENTRLKDENVKLDKLVFKNEIEDGKSVAKTEANATLLQQAMPLLAPFLQKIAGTGQNAAPIAPGLAGGEPLSAMQQHAYAVFSTLEDSELSLFAILATHIDNDELSGELVALMEKYNLLPKSA